MVLGPTRSTKKPLKLETISPNLVPGGGKLVFFRGAKIIVNHASHRLRIWFDPGSTATCLSSEMARSLDLETTETSSKQGQGIVGSVSLDKSATIKVCFKFPHILEFSAYVVESVLFKNCDLLIGSDLIGMDKPLGLYLGFNHPPKLLFNPFFGLENSSLEEMEISAHARNGESPCQEDTVRHTPREFDELNVEIDGVLNDVESEVRSHSHITIQEPALGVYEDSEVVPETLSESDAESREAEEKNASSFLESTDTNDWSKDAGVQLSDTPQVPLRLNRDNPRERAADTRHVRDQVKADDLVQKKFKKNFSSKKKRKAKIRQSRKKRAQEFQVLLKNSHILRYDLPSDFGNCVSTDALQMVTDSYDRFRSKAKDILNVPKVAKEKETIAPLKVKFADEKAKHSSSLSKELKLVKPIIKSPDELIYETIAPLMEASKTSMDSMNYKFSQSQENSMEVLLMSCHLQGISKNIEACKTEILALSIVLAEAEEGENTEVPIVNKLPYGRQDEVFVFHDLKLDQTLELQRIIESYPSVIMRQGEPPMGQANVKPFDIELKPGALDRLSKKRVRPYPLKGEHKNLMEKALDEMAHAGVGRKNPLNTAVVSPAFFAKRPRSDKLRLCVSYKDLNDETVDDIYPCPQIPDILEGMHGKKYFTLLDLRWGYWQVSLTERARKLSTMITPLGSFEYNVCTFGFKNAPSHFQRCMTNMLGDAIGKSAFVYIDDIIIASSSFEEHMEHVTNILTKLKAANLKTNLDKCHFCLKQVKLLGKVISSEGIHADPSLVKDMLSYPMPENVSQVRSWIALLGHYRHFIKDFQRIAEPLIRLTRNGVEFHISEECRNAFKILRDAMASTEVMKIPDFSQPFHLITDASKIGAGAILAQKDEQGRQRPVAYGSWLFNSAQRNYTATE